jgi:hypothetical protein
MRRQRYPSLWYSGLCATLMLIFLNQGKMAKLFTETNIKKRAGLTGLGRRIQKGPGGGKEARRGRQRGGPPPGEAKVRGSPPETGKGKPSSWGRANAFFDSQVLTF